MFATVSKPWRRKFHAEIRLFTDCFRRCHNPDDGRGHQRSLDRRCPFWWSVMNLDVNTLFLVTIYVEAILGLLLLFAWAQNTAISAVAWWGFAHLLRAASVMLFGLFGSVPDLVSI